MEFQILDSNKNAITIGNLDREAADFFGVEFDDKLYACPKGKRGLDWFNWIGYSIARQPKKGNREWREIIGDMTSTCAICKDKDEFFKDFENLRELIELCFHWKAKGYIPVSL